jgi:DNA-binding NarL/FixJ family response regulator
MSTRVMLADDHPLVPLAVRGVFEATEFELVAVAQTGSQVLPLIHQTQPELLILDLSMPGISGLRLLEQLAQRHPDLPVVVLSGDDSSVTIEMALRLGARAYIVKTLAIAELPAVLRELTAGSVYHAPKGWVDDARRDAPANAGLTAKELEILTLLADGLSNPEIAKRLWLSRETVKSHLANLYRKLNVHNRTQASKAAHELHLLNDRPSLDNVLLHEATRTPLTTAA